MSSPTSSFEVTGTRTDMSPPATFDMATDKLNVFLTLVRFSFWRLIWSANTLMILLPIAGCALFVLRRGFDKITPAENAFNAFGTFLIIVFLSFLIPICALGYGTTALGAEREERTLVFLLTRPIPRWVILFAKFLASVPLSCGLALGGFALCCRFAGPVGLEAFKEFWFAILCLTIAYLALFHLFAVTFRHPTMMALVYAIFMELFR